MIPPVRPCVTHPTAVALPVGRCQLAPGKKLDENPACRFGFYYSRAAPVLYDYRQWSPPLYPAHQLYIQLYIWSISFWKKSFFFFLSLCGSRYCKRRTTGGNNPLTYRAQSSGQAINSIVWMSSTAHKRLPVWWQKPAKIRRDITHLFLVIRVDK